MWINKLFYNPISFFIAFVLIGVGLYFQIDQVLFYRYYIVRTEASASLRENAGLTSDEEKSVERRIQECDEWMADSSKNFVRNMYVSLSCLSLSGVFGGAGGLWFWVRFHKKETVIEALGLQ